MTDPAKESPRAEVRRQARLVQSLRTAVYSQEDPAASPELLRRLAEAEALLRELEARPPDAAPPAASASAPSSRGSPPRLSARRRSTGRGEVSFRMLPTLLPERARLVTEVQWATLHIIVDILGDLNPKKQTPPVLCETHNTFPV